MHLLGKLNEYYQFLEGIWNEHKEFGWAVIYAYLLHLGGSCFMLFDLFAGLFELGLISHKFYSNNSDNIVRESYPTEFLKHFWAYLKVL